jgi:Uma2 family endonuclease
MNELAAAPPRRHRLSRADYYRMAEVGILSPDARVELIEGEIIDMPPIGARHAGAVNALIRALSLAIRERAVLSCQNPIVLDSWNEPQPDLCILRNRDDLYQESHPTVGDVLLAIEVAESSLAFDSKVKAGLYARAAIPEYWIFDIKGAAVLVHRQPEPAGYCHIARLPSPRVLSLAALPDVEIDLSSLWYRGEGPDA